MGSMAMQAKSVRTEGGTEAKGADIGSWTLLKAQGWFHGRLNLSVLAFHL